MLRKSVLYSSGGSIPAADMTSITSVVGLFEIVRDLYGGSLKEFEETRPDEESVAKHVELSASKFFDRLTARIPESGGPGVRQKQRPWPGDYRKSDQIPLCSFVLSDDRAFARAVESSLCRVATLFMAAVKKLRSAELDVQEEEWRYIVWNPVDETMNYTSKILLAEARLLSLGRAAASGIKQSLKS